MILFISLNIFPFLIYRKSPQHLHANFAHVESTQNLHFNGAIGGPAIQDAQNTVSSSVLDQHQTGYHGGGFTAGGYGGTMSQTSVGVGVNAPYP